MNHGDQHQMILGIRLQSHGSPIVILFRHTRTLTDSQGMLLEKFIEVLRGEGEGERARGINLPSPPTDVLVSYFSSEWATHKQHWERLQRDPMSP